MPQESDVGETGASASNFIRSIIASDVETGRTLAGRVPHAGRRRRLADPNPAHTRDDRGRDNGAYCDARAPKTICGASIDTVRDQHHPQSRRKVA
jgi:hypothetical protein